MKTDNPPAFPVPASDARNMFGVMDGNSHQSGMTLRDYFAAKAMQGILAGFCAQDNASVEYDKITTVAFAMADAMLKERQK